MQENKEVREDIPVEPTGLAKTGSDIAKMEDAIEQLDHRDALLQRALKLSVSQTNKSDWKDIGGTPYLQASGAHKVARLWGIGITNVKWEKVKEKDEKGPYYRYIYKAEFSMRGEPPQEVIGTCSSRDKFFGTLSEKKDKQTGETTQEAGFKKPWEIDENNIQKKAYTNCINNGIKQFTGMKDVSWEEVNMFSKGSDKIGKVEYQSGKQATEGDKKSDDDKFDQMKKWVKNTAYFKICPVEGGDGEMEVVEIKDEKVLAERMADICQRWSKYGTRPGYKTVEELKKACEGKPKMVYANYKSFETKHAAFKTDAEQLGVEGL